MLRQIPDGRYDQRRQYRNPRAGDDGGCRASQVAAVKVAARPNLILIAVMVVVSSMQYRPALIFYTSLS